MVPLIWGNPHLDLGPLPYNQSQELRQKLREVRTEGAEASVPEDEEAPCELQSKLPVSPLITLVIVPS